MAENQSADFRLIGHNLRCIRMAQCYTQAELAKAAGVDVATVHRLEAGRRVHRRTLEKVCAVFRETPEFLGSVLPYGRPEDVPNLFIHRAEDRNWFSGDDRRKRIPADSQQRIQLPEERLRLGRAGFVAWFQAYAFAMPSGPGVSLSEIFLPTQWGPNRTYEDCVTYCLRGSVRLTYADRELVLAEGEGVGHKASLAFRIEPATPIGKNQLPPLVLHITANRTGHVPIQFGDRYRKRTRHRRKGT